MAKKVLTLIKLQIPGGQANPAPPVGPALGQHGVNIVEFTKAFNAQTAHENGRIIPVEITVFEDRSFTFITKTPPAAVLIKEVLNLQSGSAEPNMRQGGQAHPGAAPLDRRDEDARPERARRRAGDEGHRRHGPLDGRGGGGMSGHGKRYTAARAKIDRENLYSPVEAIKILKDIEGAKFDETVEVHFRLGLNVRHADEQLRGTLMLPHGTGRDDAGRRVRRGRQGPRGRGGGRRHRRLGRSRREDRGRLRRLRRRDRDARPDGQRRQARPRARAARPDAEPEDGHRHVRRRARPSRTRRPASSSTAPTVAPTSTSRSARRASTSARSSRTTPRSSRRSCGRSPPPSKGRYIKGITLTSTMGPGLHVDPARMRGIVEELEEAAACRERRGLSGPICPTRPSPKTAGSPRRARAEARPRWASTEADRGAPRRDTAAASPSSPPPSGLDA